MRHLCSYAVLKLAVFVILSSSPSPVLAKKRFGGGVFKAGSSLSKSFKNNDEGSSESVGEHGSWYIATWIFIAIGGVLVFFCCVGLCCPDDDDETEESEEAKATAETIDGAPQTLPMVPLSYPSVFTGVSGHGAEHHDHEHIRPYGFS